MIEFVKLKVPIDISLPHQENLKDSISQPKLIVWHRNSTK